ncbi:unnamed protein product [Pseudo-nitzschia multistriata]|uniref:Uncharacterized protein n=1 Tax=Pseudo-nitzschia multistriata TaxID=183589 RepID=A0A448ZB39_9STRA|nr:unnamed protein product [Pseudo-nitzschia multistriata]
MTGNTPFQEALAANLVLADVKDIDHYRIHGGMAVETDYIIGVAFKGGKNKGNDANFDPFTLSKTFSHFRSFAKELKSISDGVLSSRLSKKKKEDSTTIKIGWYCETVYHLVESQKQQYVGKVNYKFMKSLAKKRAAIIAEILESTLNNFPTNPKENKLTMDVSHAIETFFRTDICIEIEDREHSDDVKNYYLSEEIKVDSKKHKPEDKATVMSSISSSASTPVVPLSRKPRSSLVTRKADLDDLKKTGKEARFLLDDDRAESEPVPFDSVPVYSQGSKIGELFKNHPVVFVVTTMGLLYYLKRFGTVAVTVDLDVMLLFVWAAFCVGLNSARPINSSVAKSAGPSRSKRSAKGSDADGRKLLRQISRRMSIRSGHCNDTGDDSDYDESDDEEPEIER